MTGAVVGRLPTPRYPEISPSSNGSAVSTGPTWPKLDPVARYGLAGKVVETLEPETEADPAALLLSLLIAFGSAAGPGPHARVESSDHPARLFGAIVGDTAKSRKGTTQARIDELMEMADPKWSKNCRVSGLSSGEGLITRAGSKEDEKRLFVHEGELVKVMTVASREGNTLSATIREIWDTGNLNVMTKVPISVRGAHISILGHITIEELHTSFNSLQAANGFGNRFLFCLARRGRSLPHGGNLDGEIIAGLAAKIGEALEAARKSGRIILRTSEANERWVELYKQMDKDAPGGILGGIIARDQAQVLRLSLTYCLIDGKNRIELDHLNAAWALWRYCRESAAYLFCSHLGNPVAEKIYAVLKERAGSLSRAELGDVFSGHVSSRAMESALSLLEERGLIIRLRMPSDNGRPTTLFMVNDA